MVRSLAVASGFAAGAAVLGIGLRALMALSSNAAPGEEGGAAADVLYAAIAFGGLAICCGVVALVVLWNLQRWLYPLPTGGAFAMGALLGAAAALIAGLGYLRSLYLAPLGRWGFLPQVVVPGLVAALLVVMISGLVTVRRALQNSLI